MGLLLSAAEGHSAKHPAVCPGAGKSWCSGGGGSGSYGRLGLGNGNVPVG